MSPKTLSQLENLAARLSDETRRVSPMQVAGLLLERAVQELTEREGHDGRVGEYAVE